MSTYYVGWDVGAWHCEKNRTSQDALYVLSNNNEEPISKRLCIRTQFDKEGICQFLKACLGKGNFKENDNYYFAIDAVFSWPKALIELICNDNHKPTIPTTFLTNPFLFRYTEQLIAAKKLIKSVPNSPRSVVQDRIGSQSTKIVFFLQKYGFEQQKDGQGIWKIRGKKIYAIETYPALLPPPYNFTESNQDIIDAYKCCLLAKDFSVPQSNLMSPQDYFDLEKLTPEERKTPIQQIDKEGWIWLPKDIWCPQKTKENPMSSPIDA